MNPNVTQFTGPWAHGPDDQGVDEHDWVIDPRRVHPHVGHHIEIVTYHDVNLAIQCEDCGELIGDIDFWVERDPIEVYGTPEHEQWLIEQERNEP
jgi:hypothetical protein